MIKNLLKQIYSFRIKEKLFFNPFISFEINSLGNYQGTNTGIKRNIPVIVSLNAKPDNYKYLPINLYSIINQSMKPDKLILWLDESENLEKLQYEITQFIKNGLEIRFVKELGRYTAAYYAIKEFPNAINVIADDEIYYETNWLKKLYASYIPYSDDIHVHLANRIKLDANSISASKIWEKHIKQESADYLNIMNKKGGILFPPNCFTKEFLRSDIFLKQSPINDELWYWIMALVHERKIRVIKNHNKHSIALNIFNFLKEKENFELKDEQLLNLLKFYRQNIINKLF